MTLVAAVVLTIVSAGAVNLGYVLEQGAAAAMPPLELRRPIRSLRILLASRRWLGGFAVETGGFLLYVGALDLAPLSVVQSIAAGGVGVLAFLVARTRGTPLRPRELAGVVLAAGGLVLLGISLSGAHGEGRGADRVAVAAWLGASGVLALLLVPIAGRRFGGAAFGAGAGVLFAAGDIATKMTVAGGWNLLFAPALIAGYGLGTTTLQLGFQRGGTLATAGIATLLTNALPIAAAAAVLNEPLPHGALGVLRVAAFLAVVVGGGLLARPPKSEARADAAVELVA